MQPAPWACRRASTSSSRQGNPGPAAMLAGRRWGGGRAPLQLHSTVASGQWPPCRCLLPAACCLLLQCTAFGTLIADLQNSTGVCSASASGITITTEREQLGIKFTCES